MTYTTREDWLAAALEEMRPMIEAAAAETVPERVRVSCALPSNYSRNGASGETWAPTASADNHHEIVVSSTLANPSAVFAALLHEVIHTATGTTVQHSKAWTAAAIALGLAPVGPASDEWARTTEGPTFDGLWSEIIEGLGPYPHGALLAGMNKPKQSTRMLKCVCPSCNWTFRATPKHISKGLPTCVCGDTFFCSELTTNEEI